MYGHGMQPHRLFILSVCLLKRLFNDFHAKRDLNAFHATDEISLSGTRGTWFFNDASDTTLFLPFIY
jgi:hypothetical protein